MGWVGEENKIDPGPDDPSQKRIEGKILDEPGIEPLSLRFLRAQPEAYEKGQDDNDPVSAEFKSSQLDENRIHAIVSLTVVTSVEWDVTTVKETIACIRFSSSWELLNSALTGSLSSCPFS